MNVSNYFRALRRWAWLIIAFAVIAVGTSAAVSLELPKVYETRTVAVVDPNVTIYPNQTVDTDTLIQTYVDLMSISALRQALIKDGIPRDEGQLAGDIIAARQSGTTLIVISVRDSDPQVTLAIARDFIPAFNRSLNDLETGIIGPDKTVPRLRALYPAEVPTVAPSVPVSPNIPANILLALVASLVVGVGLAFLFEFLDNTIKTEGEVRLRLGLPLLGMIEYRPLKKKATASGISLATVIEPTSQMSEAYRAIRTNVHFSLVDGHHQTLVVTSTIPSEGKTSTACNLAVTLAQAGQRVILVDADFRRPEVHKLFHRLDNVGLGNMILGDRPESELVVESGIPNLRVLCAGATPPNPSELLGSAAMARVITRLKEIADVVIFDTPPIGAVTDATVLAGMTDGVLLVIERGRTTVPGILRAKERLDSIRANILGVVLNKVRDAEAENYYYYYYRYQPRPDRGRSTPSGPPAQPLSGGPEVTRRTPAPVDR